MAYKIKILADSIGPNGVRLTTWELTYPRMVHSELLTHRLFSRNSASSRAIPTKTLMRQIRKDPAMPVWWGKNQKGMQAREELTGWRKAVVRFTWLQARWFALFFAWTLTKLGLHKQIANRLLEPWMFITVILTATEFENWFKLRCHPDAQPEIGWVAQEMKRQYESNVPTVLQSGDWHTPLILEEEWGTIGIGLIKKISVARCARVSYLTHDGKRDYNEDKKMHDKLAESGHWSPFEHVAQAISSFYIKDGDWASSESKWSGNLRGWKQYRETVDPTFTKVGR